MIPPDPLPASVPLEGPCQPWTDIAAVRARCGLLDTVVDDTALQFGIDLASLVLWGATGRRYGLCKRTVRPCYAGRRVEHSFYNPAEYQHPVLATTLGGVTLYRAPLVGCGCSIPELILDGPVAIVERIVADGVDVPLASLKIKTAGRNARRAVLRVDGESWPCCNDLNEDPTVANPGSSCPAWQVTYWQGRAVPALAQEMAGILAEQFGRARCEADCDNNMVAGLTRVSRRGVTKEYNQDLIKDPNGAMRTGIDLVDSWLRTVNPNKLKRRPRIVRADDPDRDRIWEWVDVA